MGSNPVSDCRTGGTKPGAKSGTGALIWHPSANFGPRHQGAVPRLIVLHYTAMDGVEAALDRLCDPAHEVSAHYLIAQDGRVFHLVKETMRAWHAGAGTWGDIQDVNSYSIGIELCNRGDHAFPHTQISSLCNLLKDLQKRWNIPAKSVIGHSDMAPARKRDPGRLFDWAMLAHQGLAVFRGQDAPEMDFLTAAQRFGYDIGQGQDAVLEAFRQRFRPTATGDLTPEDVNIIAGLAHTYPFG